jgi:putative transposase
MYRKAYKFRLYPNKMQKVMLENTFGAVRFAWNQWVENFNKPKNVARVFKLTKELRQEYSWMQEVSFNAIQYEEKIFGEFKNQFFNKNRKKQILLPKFKSKNNKQAYKLSPASLNIHMEKCKIRLAKIGWVKTVFDRNISEGVKIVNATISKDKVGDYFISILVEEEIKQKGKTNKSIGIDVGLTHFATLSNGKKFQNPRYFVESQNKIAKIQRQLTRKVKGSNRWKKCLKKLAYACRKVARQRSDFLHNLSTYLVNNFDVIAIEDLNVQGMQKNHKLAKSISDAAWSEFFRQLQYKSSWYGKTLLKVGRFEPTSKTCHICGYYKKDMTLADRIWACPQCGTVLDRDENAAINILNKAVDANTAQQTPGVSKTNEALAEFALLHDVSKVA